MSSFSFIHAADLHIDSPFQNLANLDNALADRLIEESKNAFSRLIEHCVNEKVDFLLLAGDAFDSGSGNLTGQLRFLKGMNDLKEAGIPVYIICGNHDPLDQWSKHISLPDNVYRFPGESVERKRLELGQKRIGIYGISYPSQKEDRNLAQLFNADTSDDFSIGLLHGNFGSNSSHLNYAPFTLPDLQTAGMDYWALGHIHKRQTISESKPMAIYPGNIQGRHFNEPGKKGCVKIDVNNGVIDKPKFISLSGLTFERVILDLSHVETLNDLYDKFNSLFDDLSISNNRSALVRLTLIGSTPLHQTLHEEDIRNYFYEQISSYADPFIFVDRVINNTRPVIDIEERIQSSDFIGDVLRRFQNLSSSDELLRARADKLFDDLRSSKFHAHIPDLDQEELIGALKKGQWDLIELLMQNES
ncbi:MAG: DNA repair exonuclease [Bacteroidetes bacterium]|nr:DNA repair exonuclease [Bacteroidota bacterium]